MSPLVDLPIISHVSVHLKRGDPNPDPRGHGPPFSPVFPRHEAGCREAQRKQVEDMRYGEGGERVIQIAHRIIGDTKGTIREDVGAVVEVEASGVHGGDFRAQGVIRVGEAIGARGSADGGEAGEEDVVGGLNPGLRGVEDVFGGEVGERGDEGGEGGEEEDVEGAGDGFGCWLDG